jgi:hypothetical protein
VEKRLRQALAGLALFTGLSLSVAPAHAACLPDPASSGQTVTCSGVTAGFDAGAVNNLTVNVVPGAVVNDNGFAAIRLNDSNAVTNSGTIAVGIAAAGIVITDNNVILNTGTVTTGAFGSGIFSNGQNNIITNAATGRIISADDGSGIFIAGNSTATNAGVISVGAQVGGFAGGLFVVNDNNTAINTAGASITVGNDAAGITVQGGNRNTLSNAGTITAGDFGFGISIVPGDSNTVTNSGRITGGDNASTPAPASSRSAVAPLRPVSMPARLPAPPTLPTPERSMSARAPSEFSWAAVAPCSIPAPSMRRPDLRRSNSAVAAAAC